jgi:hypothetical protein
MAPINPLFGEIDATTIDAFTKGQVSRTLFTATPWLRVLRSNKNMYRPWQGGALQRVPFDLLPVPSGAYSPGADTFNLQQQQTIDDMVFAPKFYDAEVVILATYTDVYNREPYQIVNILKEKYGNASNSLDSKVAADVYNHGQASATSVASNRIKNLNGFMEGMDDGYTPTWTGDVFPVYGNQLRNGPLTGTVLNCVPYWGGNQDGSAAPISPQILNRTYHRCKQGKGEGKVLGGKPDYGLCSDYLYGCISDRLFAMQRMEVSAGEAKSPTIGISGLKFNGAMIFPDSFVPGTQNALYIQDKSVLPSVTTSTFNLPASASTNGLLNNFGVSGSGGITAATAITVGETFWWVRSDVWRFSYPRTGRYAFKPRGLQEAFDGDILADIIRAAIVLYTLVPSSNQPSYGYNS